MHLDYWNSSVQKCEYKDKRHHRLNDGDEIIFQVIRIGILLKQKVYNVNLQRQSPVGFV